MSYRFFQWLNQNIHVFIAYKANLGFVWALSPINQTLHKLIKLTPIIYFREV